MKTLRFGFAVAVSLLCVLCSLFSPAPLAADEAAQAGKDIITKYGDAIVTLQLVVKTEMSMEGEEASKEENKAEATGVIIDPSGLTVASLSAVDPSEMMSKMMSSSEYNLKISSEVTDLKIRLADGTEIPAKIALRDKDLDLAFIRPIQKPTKPLNVLDLSKQAKPALLDQAIMLSRLGMIANRTIAASVERIQAIVEKPRTFYITGMSIGDLNLGGPVFALDGNVIGLLIMRILPTRAGGEMSFSLFSMNYMPIMPMILPASDILAAAKQVPESVQ
ncbi:MAG: serine protease [Armatimonadetes bacterium]|nr:serine protease [Armatimonadota bacterium]